MDELIERIKREHPEVTEEDVMGAPSRPPVLRFAKAGCAVRDEDVCFSHASPLLNDGNRNRTSASTSEQCEEYWYLCCLCDGHNGDGAANFVQQHLWNELIVKLPRRLPPSWDSEEGQACAACVRVAIVEALATLDKTWQAVQRLSGCTITLALVGGWLLTVANVGDALGFLDNGLKTLEMTRNHRIHGNKAEQQRLEDAGVLVAPMSLSLTGPAKRGEEGSGFLRVWPGGLAVSRSLGDIDVKGQVVCRPHIRQVLIPPTGARFMAASGNLWDLLNPRRACQLSRNSIVDETPQAVLEIVKRGGSFQLLNDILIMTVDILPYFIDDFSTISRALKRKGLMTRFCGKTIIKQDMSFYADVDSLQHTQLAPKIMFQREPTSASGRSSVYRGPLRTTHIPKQALQISMTRNRYLGKSKSLTKLKRCSTVFEEIEAISSQDSSENCDSLQSQTS